LLNDILSVLLFLLKDLKLKIFKSVVKLKSIGT